MSITTKLKSCIKGLRIHFLRTRTQHFPMIPVVGRHLIVAPHPDDEVIGCGGLICRLNDARNHPHVIILTKGENSHKECCDVTSDEIANARHTMTLDAAKILGLPTENIYQLDFKDGNIAEDMNGEKAQKLKSLIASINPDTVFVPHCAEGWPDHINASKIIREIVPENTKIYEYCVWMWYYNTWRLDWPKACQLHMTEAEHRLKLAAIDAYVKPCAPCGKPWSGVLPKMFLDANRWNRELYFRVR